MLSPGTVVAVTHLTSFMATDFLTPEQQTSPSRQVHTKRRERLQKLCLQLLEINFTHRDPVRRDEAPRLKFYFVSTGLGFKGSRFPPGSKATLSEYYTVIIPLWMN